MTLELSSWGLEVRNGRNIKHSRLSENSDMISRTVRPYISRMSVKYSTAINILGSEHTNPGYNGQVGETFLQRIEVMQESELLRMKGVIGDHFNQVFQDPKLSKL